MKHKVSELEGALLDAAVAMAEGFEFVLFDWSKQGDHDFVLRRVGAEWKPWRPTADWGEGGPIIERDDIALQPDEPFVSTEVQRAAGMPPVAWTAWQWGDPKRRMMRGAKPLVAAMRLRVARAFGDEVDL